MARRVASPVFIGRREERERVATGLAAAAEGRPVAFLVAGEAGVGKTRFIEACAAVAREAGFRVLAGACLELAEGALPYGAIVEALRPLPDELDPARLDALLGAGRPELVRVMPALGTVGANAGNPEGSAQGRLFELLLGFLDRLAAERPLLCVLEDLQWADRSTLDLITYTVRTLRRGRIVLLASYRTDELSMRHPLRPALAGLERSGRIERIDLVRFTREELAAQLASILGFEPEPPTAERIWARSAGNAFYAEELLASGAAQGRLPETLREILLARVADLSPSIRELLRAAAVGGARLTGPLLAAVSGASAPEVRAALREAVDRGLLLPREDGEADTYLFRHALLQEALESDLLPGERAELHAAYARALEASADRADPSLAALIAHHWYAAHDPPHALPASVAAGLAAERAYAFPEAQAQYERALELWDRASDAAGRGSLDRIGVLERAASAADAAGAPDRALTHIQAALALADAAADPVRTGLLLDALGHLLREADDGEGALAAHREAVRLVPADPPSAARAQVLEGLARCLMIVGQLDEAEVLAGEALGVARETRARAVEAHALSTLGPCVGHLGRVDAATATLREGRDLALAIGDVAAAIRAWINLEIMLRIAGRLEDAVVEGSAGAAWADAHGLGRSAGAHLRAANAGALWELGRWDEAEQRLALVRRVLPGADVEPRSESEQVYQLLSALLDLGRGRLDEAARRLARARQLARPQTRPMFEVIARYVGGQLSLANGDIAAARQSGDDLLAALVALDAGNFTFFCGTMVEPLQVEAEAATRARSRRDTAGLVEARQRGSAILALARTQIESVLAGHPSFGPRLRAALALCEAEWSRLEGTPDQGLWVAAAAACAAASQRQLRPYVLYRQAEAMLGASGDRSAATVVLREAHVAAASMGAAPVRSQIEALARRARVALGAAAGDDIHPQPSLARFGLTRREREVLALLVAGRTNRQIGDELFISEATASVHVSNILGKLGVAGRTEAATLAQRVDLLGDPAP